jgi:hypothetical protein
VVAIRLWRLGKSGGTQGNAEASAVVAVRRVAPVPERRPTKRGLVEPTVPPHSARDEPLLGPLGSLLGPLGSLTAPLGVVTVPIAATFPDITVHVLQIDPRHSRLIVVLAQKLLAYTQKTAQAG